LRVSCFLAQGKKKAKGKDKKGKSEDADEKGKKKKKSAKGDKEEPEKKKKGEKKPKKKGADAGADLLGMDDAGDDKPTKAKAAKKEKEGKAKKAPAKKVKITNKTVKLFAPVELSLEEFGGLMQNSALQWFPGMARLALGSSADISKVSAALAAMLNAHVVETLQEKKCSSLYSKSSADVHLAVLAKLSSPTELLVQLKCTDKATKSKLVKYIETLEL
jgi:hypothetical protein